jgi:hypothetical protein
MTSSNSPTKVNSECRVSEDCFGGSDKRQTEEEPVQDQKEVKYTLDKMNLIHAMNLTF